MSRFYFHVRAGEILYEDHEGMELIGVDAAFAHAVDDARTMLRDDPERMNADRWIEVVDDIGHTLRRVPLETVA